MTQTWRQTTLYRVWRIAVILAGGKICAICDNNKELHAHHIKDAARFPELRFIVENGVCICNDCHKYIHTDICGSYGAGCDDTDLGVLKGLRYHRRILRKKKEKLMKKAGLKL